MYFDKIKTQKNDCINIDLHALLYMHKKTVHNLHLSNLHIVCNLQSILHVEIGEKVVQEKKSRDTLFVHENKN